MTTDPFRTLNMPAGSASQSARQWAKTAPLATSDAPLADLPRRADRRIGAALVTQHLFPVSPRTLERWPLAWRRVNGKAVCDTAELFAVAERMLAEAPAVRGGRSKAG